MTNIRRITLAGAAAVLLVAGALLGGIVATAEAQTPQCWTTTTGVQLCRSVASTPTPEPTPEAIIGEDADASEAVMCSIITGCSIVVTDAEGVPIRTMHVTFSDVGEAELSAE